MKKISSKVAKLMIFSCLVFGVSLNGLASTKHDHKKHHSISIRTLNFKPVALNPVQKNQFEYITSKLNEHNMPRALAIIPIIESRYNNHAVSNKGAGGIWQLMPATASHLGIRANDRFELAPSTKAALNYFKELHRKFNNWEFAIAAYNAGDGRVLRALHKNPNATSVEQLNLPMETKQYVKKFYNMQAKLTAYSL